MTEEELKAWKKQAERLLDQIRASTSDELLKAAIDALVPPKKRKK